jgi:hypothetical protein
MPDPREPLGRLVHEQRLAHNAELDRPFGLEPWETRSPRQRELDMLIGAAVRDRVLNAGPGRGELVRETWVYWALEQPDVAEHPNWLKSWAELDERGREVDDRIYSAVAAVVRARAEQAEAQLAEVRTVISTYFTVHGNSTGGSLQSARDLAEGIRQVLDREPQP